MVFIVEVGGSGMIPVQLLARKLDGGVGAYFLHRLTIF